MNIVSTRLPQRDLISLLLVSPWINRNLISHPSLWLVLDFHEMNNAGDRLVSALSLSRYQNVKHINLEFARDIEEKHLEIVKNKCGHSIRNLEVLNLNGCQKISDTGIELITYNCPKLKVFSIYWNVRVLYAKLQNLTDESLKLIAENYQGLQMLNLTRCIKLTDRGLKMILLKCSSLRRLNLYALSSFTDVAYKKISLLIHLQFLDLCGAQNLSDDGLSCIAKCKNLVSLNLTWCVRVTDEGVIAIAENCRSLEFLSLFGIVGVTDKSLEALSSSCSNTITTLDVNGCIGIKRRSHDQLLRLFPKLRCFKVHS
ncbi:hypothetical protein DH2020_048736 [Rehmannia glutinosa]|uniref:F-box/LRR-repeat protein 15-like leucin rich repeat domain-containing protein n=1 Tax=Rehmannia glutinosa TaxID=99300 RepID=A0ABR0U4U6_REHGL